MALWLWIVIILLVLMVLFKIKEVRHKLGLVVIAGILIFLLISLTQIYTTTKVD